MLVCFQWHSYSAKSYLISWFLPLLLFLVLVDSFNSYFLVYKVLINQCVGAFLLNFLGVLLWFSGFVSPLVSFLILTCYLLAFVPLLLKEYLRVLVLSYSLPFLLYACLLSCFPVYKYYSSFLTCFPAWLVECILAVCLPAPRFLNCTCACSLLTWYYCLIDWLFAFLWSVYFVATLVASILAVFCFDFALSLGCFLGHQHCFVLFACFLVSLLASFLTFSFTVFLLL